MGIEEQAKENKCQSLLPFWLIEWNYEQTRVKVSSALANMIMPAYCMNIYYSTILCYIVLYCAMLYYTVICSTVVFYSVLYYGILY